MLELLTLQGSSPRIQWCIQEEELGIDVPFRPGRYLHVHGVVASRLGLLDEAGKFGPQRGQLHDDAIHAVVREWLRD